MPSSCCLWEGRDVLFTLGPCCLWDSRSIDNIVIYGRRATDMNAGSELPKIIICRLYVSIMHNNYYELSFTLDCNIRARLHNHNCAHTYIYRMTHTCGFTGSLMPKQQNTRPRSLTFWKAPMPMIHMYEYHQSSDSCASHCCIPCFIVLEIIPLK